MRDTAHTKSVNSLRDKRNKFIYIYIYTHMYMSIAGLIEVVTVNSSSPRFENIDSHRTSLLEKLDYV